MTDPQHDIPKGEGPDIAFAMGAEPSPAATPGSSGPIAPDTNDSGPEGVSPVREAGAPDSDADSLARAANVPDSGADSPDVLTSDLPAPEQDSSVALSQLEERAGELAQEIASALAAAGPEGWSRLEAAFALTVAGGVRTVFFYDDADQVAQVEPSAEVTELVGRQREVSAELGDGPWWRMLIEVDSDGEVEVDYDYGDVPFPDEHMLAPEAYVADLEAFPREWLPVWLAAYIRHGNRQWRSPQQAAVRARADRDIGVAAVRSHDDFPALPVAWARWATIAAAFVAVGSEWGPRILPALGVFEGSARSGSTLYVLPGGRAVLSGGVWDAPELNAAYNEGAPLPDLYAGAPAWVTNQVLNPRAGRGLQSFCYWWEGGAWHRAESPTSDRLSAAVPGIWTVDTVIDVVGGLVGGSEDDEMRSAAAVLVAAAEAGVVTRDTLAALFTGPDDDLDGALHQLSMAGLVTTVPEELPEERAIALVREFIDALGLDTTGYPLDELVAERLTVGWMVFVPTGPGEIIIGRAIFYIADDGVIEQSSSSVAPSIYIEEFEQRFRQRHQGAVADFSV
ncbi:hypothetical protein [Nocardia mexicana]|uniref:Uncharacterized protein n=1 Tax=Nocardia mexicana TaxID=279262 RepID=A0A370HDM1_9NOCA|nr:hypothetical protein [Nocardia mexicana]RDI55331.1 hypothetical protein DFR68_101164 [Nocardia mexicana]